MNGDADMVAEANGRKDFPNLVGLEFGMRVLDNFVLKPVTQYCPLNLKERMFNGVDLLCTEYTTFKVVHVIKTISEGGLGLNLISYSRYTRPGPTYLFY